MRGEISRWTPLVSAMAIAAIAHAQVVDPHIRVVDDDAPPGNTCPGGLPQGRCWEDPFTDLQDALDAALGDPEITEIWVVVHSGGGYLPSVGGGPGPGLRSASFKLQDELALYGGFLVGETSRSERDPEANETVLTGLLPITPGCPDPSCFVPGAGCVTCFECEGRVCDADPTCCLQEWDEGCAQTAHELCEFSFNTYHVVTAEAVTNTAQLNGFTVAAGVADGNGYLGFGGFDNYANTEWSGGGILIEGSEVGGGGPGPIIARCDMIDNRAVFGAGLATDGPTNAAIQPALVNLEFRSNGAIFVDPDDLIVPGAPGVGAGAWSGPGSRELWANCLFAGNAALDRGGGLFMVTGTELNITNCTFADNLADSDADGLGEGGGLYMEEASPKVGPFPTEIGNGIFWGNADSTGTGPNAQIHVVLGLDVTLLNSDVEVGLPDNVVDGDGNIHVDPEFVAPGVGNYRLQAISPCIDVVCYTTLPPDSADLDENGDPFEPTPKDLDFLPRMQLGSSGIATGVDMGAYERAGSACQADCEVTPDLTVDINDFLRLLTQWDLECVSCDFNEGPSGVGIEDFLKLLADWGPCPEYTGSPPKTIEEVVTEAGLVYPDDWDAFVDAMTDPNVSEAEKANWRCWMDHYLDCHRRPFCPECACLICPDVDPYGNHFPFP